MRLVVFFDLPVLTAADRKAYRLFRKHLIKQGYLMLQESVYAKLAINEHAAASAILDLENNKPNKGLVQVLRVTEKQFTTMTFITGTRPEYDEIDSSEDLLVL